MIQCLVHWMHGCITIQGFASWEMVFTLLSKSLNTCHGDSVESFKIRQSHICFMKWIFPDAENNLFQLRVDYRNVLGCYILFGNYSKDVWYVVGNVLEFNGINCGWKVPDLMKVWVPMLCNIYHSGLAYNVFLLRMLKEFWLWHC